MTAPDDNFPSLRERFLACLGYWGLAPYLYWPRRDKDGFLPFQLRQALAVYGLLAAVGILAVVVVLAISYVMVFQRELFDDRPVEAYMLGTLRKVFLCWLVFWGFGSVLAAAGSWREMPVVRRLACKPVLIGATAWLLVAAQATTLLAGALTLHGLALTRQDERPAKVYYLYEDVEAFPRWLFVLGFYPMAVASHRCFGPGQVVVEKLNRDAIVRAVESGAVVFIGSHGTARGLMVPEGYFEAHEVQTLDISPALRFVYLTGCDQKATWVDAFAPAEVVTYDRLTAVVEHLWWMWLEGPGVVCQVASELGGKDSMTPKRPEAP